MFGYTINVRRAIVIGVAIAAVGAASTAGARPIGDPPTHVHRIQPQKSTRNDPGFTRCSGCHVRVYSAPEAKTE
jgi:hypothetical protein